MSQQEKGRKGMSHGPSPQERGRRGAAARQGKNRPQGEEIEEEEYQEEAQGEETRTSRSGQIEEEQFEKVTKGKSTGRGRGKQQEENLEEREQEEESSQKSHSDPGKKSGSGRPMSPHDKGVLGAEARWGKHHEQEESGHQTQRGA